MIMLRLVLPVVQSQPQVSGDCEVTSTKRESWLSNWSSFLINIVDLTRYSSWPDTSCNKHLRHEKRKSTAATITNVTATSHGFLLLHAAFSKLLLRWKLFSTELSQRPVCR